MRSPDRTAYPLELETAEAALVRERREAFKAGSTSSVSDDARLLDNALGFGLSGGGIRSATFCLGLFQAIARASRLHEIDFLSTVSGGGYFGSFLGRLFTRDWIRGVNDAAYVLRGIDPPDVAAVNTGWAWRTFRWLRENGRYLAPRGSGDLLVLGAILMRNWIAVQVVMVTTVLTLFVALQALRGQLESVLGMKGENSFVANLLVCGFPGGSSIFWWSPWIALVVPILILAAVPDGWAYWLVTRRPDGKVGVSPTVGAALVGLIGLAGAFWYRPSSVQPLQFLHPERFWISALVALSTALVLAYWLVGEYRVKGKGSPTETGNLLRNRLTQYLKRSLLWCGVVMVWTIIDTTGGTFYAAASGASLTRWGASLLAMFAGIGAFAQPASLLLRSTRGRSRPGVSLSILSWTGAVVVLALWLVSIDVASHAIAWNFGPTRGAPGRLAIGPPKTLLGADRVEVTRAGEGFLVTAGSASEPICTAPAVMRPAPAFPIGVLVVLLVFTVLFGRTRTFANMSSIHAFYAARLTRTFLGASNAHRVTNQKAGVTDTIRGDDCSSAEYWNWPTVVMPPSALPTTPPSDSSILSRWLRRVMKPLDRARTFETGMDWPVRKPWTKGGPLHILNVTVNETVDARTKVQNQDRKGTGLAIGPCGLSLGVRHHLVQQHARTVVVHPTPASGAYRVFRLADEGARTPDPLSLGRWVSVSGAAFSAAAGANTSVPMAILSGMFNVRLGYWWNSGTPPSDRSAWMTFEQILPVQAALLAEALASTRGTAGRLWNLSDGGHFENMGGYELIRRRLPVIVIVDAEADPDYTFHGLSDLVRKARLDFDAEVIFLTDAQLSDTVKLADGRSVRILPESVRPCFGDIGALRRGRWSGESIPTADGESRKRYTLEVDRTRVSRAHAALARVEYSNGDMSWLVYVKATLMGDEPEDVCHYHRAHPEFPQETTIDQFFDEAQWESYRRLGMHIGHRVLTPVFFDHLRTLSTISCRADSV